MGTYEFIVVNGLKTMPRHLRQFVKEMGVMKHSSLTMLRNYRSLWIILVIRLLNALHGYQTYQSPLGKDKTAMGLVTIPNYIVVNGLKTLPNHRRNFRYVSRLANPE